MYGRAKDYFANGGTIPDKYHELGEELEASYYDLDNKNRLMLLKKDEQKKYIGKSPDMADAFCLSLMCDGDLYSKPSQSEIRAQVKQQNNLIMAGGWG